MLQMVFRNWKAALLWAIGTGALVGAFFVKGGGEDRVQGSAEQAAKSNRDAQAMASDAASHSQSIDDYQPSSDDEESGDPPDDQKDQAEDSGP